jgi:hypothetical protein
MRQIPSAVKDAKRSFSREMAAQFIVLGLISVALNTSAWAAIARTGLEKHTYARSVRRNDVRLGSVTSLCASISVMSESGPLRQLANGSESKREWTARARDAIGPGCVKTPTSRIVFLISSAIECVHELSGGLMPFGVVSILSPWCDGAFLHSQEPKGTLRR